MKKLLTILGSFTIAGVPVVSVVSCGSGGYNIVEEVVNDKPVSYPPKNPEEDETIEVPSSQKQILTSKNFNVLETDTVNVVRNNFRSKFNKEVQSKLENEAIKIYDENGKEIVSGNFKNTKNITLDIVDSEFYELAYKFSRKINNISSRNPLTQEQISLMENETMELYSMTLDQGKYGKYLSSIKNPFYFKEFKRVLSHLTYTEYVDGGYETKPIFKYKNIEEFSKDININVGNNKVFVELNIKYYLNETFNFKLEFDVKNGTPDNFSFDLKDFANTDYKINRRELLKTDLKPENLARNFDFFKNSDLTKTGNDYIDEYLSLGGNINDFIDTNLFDLELIDNGNKMKMSSKDNSVVKGVVEFEVNKSEGFLDVSSLTGFNKEYTLVISKRYYTKKESYIYLVEQEKTNYLNNFYHITLRPLLEKAGVKFIFGSQVLRLVNKDDNDEVFFAGKNVKNIQEDQYYVNDFNLRDSKFDLYNEEVRNRISNLTFKLEVAHFKEEAFGTFDFDLKIKFE